MLEGLTANVIVRLNQVKASHPWLNTLPTLLLFQEKE